MNKQLRLCDVDWDNLDYWIENRNKPKPQFLFLKSAVEYTVNLLQNKEV